MCRLWVCQLLKSLCSASIPFGTYTYSRKGYTTATLSPWAVSDGTLELASSQQRRGLQMLLWKRKGGKRNGPEVISTGNPWYDMFWLFLNLMHFLYVDIKEHIFWLPSNNYLINPHFWSWSEPSITPLPWTLFHTTPGRRQSSWSAQTLHVITGHKNQCKI